MCYALTDFGSLLYKAFTHYVWRFWESEFELALQKRMWPMYSKGTAHLPQYHCMAVCEAYEHDFMYMDAKQPFRSLDVEKHILQSASIFFIMRAQCQGDEQLLYHMTCTYSL